MAEDISNRVKKIIVNHLGIAGDKIQDNSKFIEDLGLKTRLSSLSLSFKETEIVVQQGFNLHRINNNPRKVTEETIKEILSELH